ncbi:MAG TPA: hypothetical protein PKY12_10215 [Catalimonadaceae bacterium]|nr:hypothetical protein [Catalimonadaceae bacterium]
MSEIKTITIDPTLGNVKLEIKFFGDAYMAYEYLLWSADSSSHVKREIGNNEVNTDDAYFLPTPLEQNRGRWTEFVCRILAKKPDINKTYRIEATAYQDGEKLDTAIGLGTLTGDPQNEILGFKFIMP